MTNPPDRPTHPNWRDLANWPTRRAILEYTSATATLVTLGLVGKSVAAQDDAEVGADDTDEDDGETTTDDSDEDATGTATDDLPTYSNWLPADEAQALEFVAVDWETLTEYASDELEDAQPDDDIPAAFEADPMIAPVSEGALSAYLFVGLDLAQFGLGRLLDDDEAFDSTVSTLLQTSDTYVVLGEIDPAEIDERLTAEPAAEFISQLEQTDEIDGYEVYTPVEDTAGTAIAVGGDALVVVDDEAVDAPAVLESTIGAAGGTADRAVDGSESVAWALETAGGGDVVVGQLGAPADSAATADDGDQLVDFAYPALEGAETIVSSLTIEDAETSTGSFAAVIDDPDETALTDVLGASGTDQSVDVDENRVTATAMWHEADVAVAREL
ncbi:hypothetical protein C483_06088 [Natrialba hulunbeirensis JCM 10989]|uniref:Uncharacterized protein n=1 Tax=Natrialba hulunbeirensis JCM 10989 TaxID=1227493 RepID=M0A5B8_9EURY|nr:hypothetical protein [Natrialba hulunbeirensis]ELY93511.1 hypothetical protein C483_06088 [Natrialba hulunbeirensis JCM 10989]